MKPGWRTLLMGAAVIAAATLLSVREGRRPAQAGGPCCPLIPGLGVVPSNRWAGPHVGSINTGLRAGEAVTNQQR
jgi:hypothetical protein